MPQKIVFQFRFGKGAFWAILLGLMLLFAVGSALAFIAAGLVIIAVPLAAMAAIGVLLTRLVKPDRAPAKDARTKAGASAEALGAKALTARPSEPQPPSRPKPKKTA